MTSRGPKLTEKGTIIPYTILGKAEWFKNYPPSKEVNATIENKAQNSTYSEVHSSKPFIERKAEDSQKYLEKITVVLKKEDVLQEINKIKGRVYQIKEKKDRKVPLSAKYFQNKEKNCLDHFEDLERKWDLQSKFYSKKVSRSIYDKPLYQKGECYRQKLELAQVVDNLKTWECTVRKYEEIKKVEKKNDENKTFADLKRESTFKKTLANQDKNHLKNRPASAQIEAIRNPKLHSNEMPFSSFKSDNYLKKKLIGFEEKISEMHAMVKPGEVGSLFVISL